MDKFCKHGFPLKFERTDRECPYDQPDGATVTDLHVLDTFEITGRGTSYLVESLANKRALIGRMINLDGVPMVVTSFESCLIPGHDEGHCQCFRATEILAKPFEVKPYMSTFPVISKGSLMRLRIHDIEDKDE